MGEPLVNTNDNDPANQKTIVLVGASGHLGKRIAVHLLQSQAKVTALVRQDSDLKDLLALEDKHLTITEVDFKDVSQLANACKGADCVASAVSGLEDVMIDLQTNLLEAALDAKVPRFIPSDFSIDYTNLSYGSNRNLDLRKRFNEKLSSAPIRATSILNGMFTDLLTGQAPLVLFGLKKVVYWGDAQQLLDFTTLENTAEFTALAALDDSAPRYLRIAGDVINAEGLKLAASESTGHTFSLLRAGGLSRLRTMIKITKMLFPGRKEIFPAWQGMQYMHDMFTGKPKLQHMDDDRYPGISWTSVEEVLSSMRSR